MSELSDLRSLNVRNNQVTSLSGLESLDELNDLTLSENALTEPDLTKISNATSLTYLNVSGTDLGSIVGIESLTQLRDLNIAETRLRGSNALQPLSNLSRLTTLYAWNARIQDISGLEGCTDLEQLLPGG